MKNEKKICVIGLGYIGLPTAALLASNGYIVAGIDSNQSVVDMVNQGKIHIIEPDLDVCVSSAVSQGKLRAFSTVQVSEVYMICVPTPFLLTNDEIPRPNLNYVFSAIQSIAFLLKPGDLVILESTSPVGTIKLLEKKLQEMGVDVSKIYLAYCPERVLPGKIMVELLENDRIVGGITPEATLVVSEFYKTFVRGLVIETDAKTAEMCKLTENSFRDLNIAFANELSLICSKEDINVWELIDMANHHPRVNILKPGVGVGGHCIAVDPWFIVARNPEYAHLIRAAREVNNYKTTWVIEQIKLAAEEVSTGIIKKPKIACFGISFKPNIDDLRESPALQIVELLLGEKYDVLVIEPNIDSHKSFHLISIEEALDKADIFVMLVGHGQFKRQDLLENFRGRKVLDFCGIMNQA